MVTKIDRHWVLTISHVPTKNEIDISKTLISRVLTRHIGQKQPFLIENSDFSVILVAMVTRRLCMSSSAYLEFWWGLQIMRKSHRNNSHFDHKKHNKKSWNPGGTDIQHYCLNKFNIWFLSIFDIRLYSEVACNPFSGVKPFLFRF